MNELNLYELFHLGSAGIILQLIFLECILSIDNAAVMGAMVARLPDDQATPWPARLRRFVGWLDPLLGQQQAAALKVGLFGAYAGRILMLLLATIIMRLAWMQILGALYLLYLGVQHFGHHSIEARLQGAPESPPQISANGNFWSVVLVLNLADLAFSLDNVVAAVALSNQFWIVVIEVGVGIAVMRFAAMLFTGLIAWEPALESAAYLLVMTIGSELLLDRLFGVHIGDFARFGLSVCILLLTIGFARIASLRPLLVIFRPGLATCALICRSVRVVRSGTQRSRP